MKEDFSRFMVRVDAENSKLFKIALIKRQESVQKVLYRNILKYIEDTEQLEKEGHLK